MKTNLSLLLFVLFIFQFSFAQKEITIKGKVIVENLPIQGVEVVNFESKTNTLTDQNGSFSILAKVKTYLMFNAKGYDLKKIMITEDETAKNELVVILSKKIEELDEVLIKKKEFEVPKITQDQIANILIDKSRESITNPFVNQGTIKDGLDFVKIGSFLGSLFKKNKEQKTKTTKEIVFQEMAKADYNQAFYTDVLQLKPDEINLFLEYCSSDPKSEEFTQQPNNFKLMDFLITKREEFKKLPKN